MITVKGLIIVHEWMISKLKLSGNELLTYAIIYGFSRDGKGVFSETSWYLAYTLCTTRQAALRILKRLVEKKHLIKIDKIVNGVRRCDYIAIIPDDGITTETQE